MKLLHIIPTMNPKYGGPSQGIRNYEYGLKGLDVKRTIVCFDNPEDIKFWENGDLIIYGLGGRSKQWQYNNKFSNWIKENIAAYDVVIINGLWLYHSYQTIKTIKILKQNKQFVPKVYIMPHGMLDPWFQNTQTRLFKSMRNEVYWRLIEKNVVNSADGLLFTCEEELNLARQSFIGYNPKKEINVGYGIECPPTQSGLMNSIADSLFKNRLPQKYWLFLSRVNEKKGIDILIDSYSKLLEKNPKNDLPDLVIAGPGMETAFGETILQIVSKSIFLQKKIHFTGMISGNAKWGTIYNSEAFILPSHQENFGIAVAEALACGKPVLISNQVNIWKVITDSGAGLVCEDNSDSIYEMLKKFYELKKEDKALMAKQALFAYGNFFDVKKTAKILIEALIN